MTYYAAKELAEAFRTVRKNTLTIAGDIPEEQYGFRASADTQTVAEMLTHIALANQFPYEIHGVLAITTFEGFDFVKMRDRIMAEAAKKRTKAEIVELLEKDGEQFARWLEGLTEEFLGQKVMMRPGMVPGEKTRFEMLLGAKEHEMHHRAQLMLMQRMMGVKPHLTKQREAILAALAERAAASTANA